MEGEKFEASGIDEHEEFELSPREEEHIHKIISELHEPIRKMLEPIMENIEGGEYQLLIGDDASGRIPTLIVRTIINSIYAKNGHASIPTRFIAGTRHYRTLLQQEYADAKKAKVAQYIEELHALMPDVTNALIVTDTISSGNSLLPVTESLKESGIHYDIAAVGVEDYEYNREILQEKLGAFVFSGSDWMPSIYGEHDISGVTKFPEDLHSRPVRKELHPGTESSVVTQKIISRAREEAKLVAANILADYGKSEGEGPNIVDSEKDTNTWELGEEEHSAA